MADGILSFSHGAVALDGRSLPGILASLSVRGQVRYDEAEQDGVSGKAKTPLGWEDDAITLVLALTTEDGSTCYDKLANINGLFVGQDSSGNPLILDVANPHMRARGVNEVVFDGLESTETEDDDVILATLRFTEHNPPVVKAERRAAGKTNAPGTNATAGLDERFVGRGR